MTTATATDRESESQRAQAKRQQIRDAARRLFLSEGFEATSMDAVTAAAGVSKRTLYKYYPSKEALLADTVYHLTLGNRRGDLPVDPDQLAVGSVEALEALLTWIAGDIVAHHRDPEFVGLLRIIVAETPRFPRLADQYRAAVIEPGFAFLSAILDHARETGVVTADDTAAAVRFFMGGLLFATYTYGLMATGPPCGLTHDEIREHVRLLMRAIT